MEADPQLSQREIGERLGRSGKWVRQLVQWHTSGATSPTPYAGTNLPEAQDPRTVRRIARQNPQAIVEAIAEAPKEACRGSGRDRVYKTYRHRTERNARLVGAQRPIAATASRRT